jgi:hypothetical protein
MTTLTDLRKAAAALRALADAADARVKVFKRLAPVMAQAERRYVRALSKVMIVDAEKVTDPAQGRIGF